MARRLPESAEEVFSRGMVPELLRPPGEAEEPRCGEGGKPCSYEAGERKNAIWRNERWVVTAPEEPGSLHSS